MVRGDAWSVRLTVTQEIRWVQLPYGPLSRGSSVGLEFMIWDHGVGRSSRLLSTIAYRLQIKGTQERIFLAKTRRSRTGRDCAQIKRCCTLGEVPIT